MINTVGEALSAVADSLGPEAPSIRVSVGPHVVGIRFGDVDLAKTFAGAFVVTTTERPADFHIDVMSGEDRSYPFGLPPPAENEVCFQADGEGYVLWLERSARILYAVDRRTRRALCWVDRPKLVPPWERSRPFLPIFQAILHPTSWLAVHAAAIARDGRAILMAGNSKAGKTSLALAGLEAGWRFLGDDFVLLRADDAPAVAPLYATARPRDDMWSRFLGFELSRREVSVDIDGPRHELVFQDAHPPKDTVAPLAFAILIDRRGASTPRFESVSRAKLISTLLSTTTVETPGFLQHHLRKLGRLLGGTEVMSFDPGTGVGTAIHALERVFN